MRTSACIPTVSIGRIIREQVVFKFLLRQRDLAVDVEMAGDFRRSRIGLTSADADRVVPRGDDRLADIRHHAEIAIRELEMNLPALARIEMDPPKSAKCDARRSCEGRKLEVKLRDLISRKLADIRNSHCYVDGIAGAERHFREDEIAIGKVCIAQAIAEGIEWLAGEVPVGTVLHRVVFELRQLVHIFVKRDRQPAGGIVPAA